MLDLFVLSSGDCLIIAWRCGVLQQWRLWCFCNPKSLRASISNANFFCIYIFIRKPDGADAATPSNRRRGTVKILYYFFFIKFPVQSLLTKRAHTLFLHYKRILQFSHLKEIANFPKPHRFFSPQLLCTQKTNVFQFIWSMQ